MKIDKNSSIHSAWNCKYHKQNTHENKKYVCKIIYGLRRSGKSVILNQIIEGIKESGVDNEYIVYINFEILEYNFIKNAVDLDKYIKSLVKDEKTYYIF